MKGILLSFLIAFTSLPFCALSQTSKKESGSYPPRFSGQIEDLRTFYENYSLVLSCADSGDYYLTINSGGSVRTSANYNLNTQRAPCPQHSTFGSLSEKWHLTDIDLKRFQWRIFKKNMILQTPSLQEMSSKEKSAFMSTEIEPGDVIYVRFLYD